MTNTPTSPRYFRTCAHSWHVAGIDGLPWCRGDECRGFTIACGQGRVPCPRHTPEAYEEITVSDPTPTEPADSLDDLRSKLATARDHVRATQDYWGKRIADLEDAIVSAETDERPVDFTPAPDASQVPHGGERFPASYHEQYETVRERVSSKVQRDYFERIESPSDRDLIDALAVRVERLEAEAFDRMGEATDSTAAALAIRAEVNTKHEQAKARWLAVQHGGRPAERDRALMRSATWRDALGLVDRIIAERMS